MKLSACSSILTFCVLPATTFAFSRTLVDETGGEIPDGSFIGLSRSLEIDRPGETITSMSIDVSLSSSVDGGATYLGDLYLYLTDGTSLLTLANRPGQDVSLSGGYDDEHGFQVTFTDSASADFHVYRESLPGGGTETLPAVLVGEFQPDGRVTDPTDVITGDPRVGQISDFYGGRAVRSFTLFAADLSGGAAHQIDRWSLNIETIPEPSASVLLLAALAAIAGRRSREDPARGTPRLR